MSLFIQKSFFLLFLSSSLLLGACQAPAGPHVITPEGDIIRTELALTAEERQEGLMFREALAADAGMLFVYERPRAMAFWMKNTLIPLDLVYIDADQYIVDIQTMTPCPETESQCAIYPSAAKAQYALEINAGKAEEWNLHVGDQLGLEF